MQHTATVRNSLVVDSQHASLSTIWWQLACCASFWFLSYLLLRTALASKRTARERTARSHGTVRLWLTHSCPAALSRQATGPGSTILISWSMLLSTADWPSA